MRVSLVLLILSNFLFSHAQNNSEDSKLFYAFSFGAGIGRSPNFELSEIGIGGMINVSAQKNKSIATLGYRGTGEFQVLGPVFPSVTMTSVDVLYGRVMSDKKIALSMNAGIALVGNLERGQFLYAEPGFFGATHYERVKSFGVGLPVSTKAFVSLSNHFALGLEGYININSRNTFYGLNLCGALKKYTFGKKDRHPKT